MKQTNILLFLLLLSVLSWNAHAKRLAFVVGIAQYENLHQTYQLKNPTNDSAAIFHTLKNLNYASDHHINLTRSEFYTAYTKFLDKVNKGDSVVIFLSGHGMEIDGQNYLLPKDSPQAKYGRENALKRHSLSIPEILQDVRERSPANVIFILDACRTHPLIPPEYQGNLKAFPGVKSSGLAQQESAIGEYLMFSAGAGEAALDALGISDKNNNSLYVRHLIPLMQKPGLEIGRLNTILRTKVYKDANAIGHKQIPMTSNQLIGADFCFAGCDSADEIADDTCNDLSTTGCVNKLSIMINEGDKKGTKLLRAMCIDGIAYACSSMSNKHADRNSALGEDEAKSKAYLLAACDFGGANGCTNYGLSFGDNDLNLFEKYLLKACKLNSTEGCMWLAEFYMENDKIEEAIGVLKMGCEGDAKTPCFSLSMYFHQLGEQQKANYYYQYGCVAEKRWRDIDLDSANLPYECT